MMAVMAEAMMHGTTPPTTERRPRYLREDYRHPDPKNTDNSPDRAKGMKPFEVDGVTVWAGTLKAAIKKARLLSKLT
jgi:hypothetical protein